MKKLIPAFLISAIIVSQAAVADTSDWLTYNGYTQNHIFSAMIPADWKAIQSSDQLQGFIPEDPEEELTEITLLSIKEFEGQTYDQVVDYYTGSSELIYIDDIIYNESTDLIGKHAVFHNTEVDKNFAITLTKRGDIVIAVTEPNLPGVLDFPSPDIYQDQLKEIYDSFKFTSEWHNYVDYKNGYTFSFPLELSVTTDSNGVTLSDKGEVFSVVKYEGILLDDAPDYAEDFGDSLESTEEITLPGAEKALNAIFHNTEEDKNYSRIFVENNGDSFSFTNVNIEENYPHKGDYDSEILEILNSFEFFTLKEDQENYEIFYDVSESNINKEAINELAGTNVISGYADGSFKPDGKINRAELTKMVVAATQEPDPEVYKNCFPDVKEEWFAPYICYAAEQGWVKGYMDETFKPGRNINRVETIKIVLEVLFDSIPEESLNVAYEDINSDGWYLNYFAYAVNNDLLDLQHVEESEKGEIYLPGESTTRKEVAELIFRSLQIVE